jgi:hypothetical protein
MLSSFLFTIWRCLPGNVHQQLVMMVIGIPSLLALSCSAAAAAQSGGCLREWLYPKVVALARESIGFVNGGCRRRGEKFFHVQITVDH